MFRSVARIAARRIAVAAPSRSFTVSAARYGLTKDGLNDNQDLPAGLNLRADTDGVKWADYRPQVLREIKAERNEAGDLVGSFEGEDVIFPDLEPTLEWVLSTPVDLHLFEEAPIIKMYSDETTPRS